MKIHRVLILLTTFLLVACGTDNQPPPADTPSAVLKLYVAASQRKDIAAMKRLLSKSSVELIEKSAKVQDLTIDDILQKEASVEIKKLPETRNEKIEGDVATVEVKNEKTGAYDMKYPLVKEDGAWKIARDKYIAEMIQKANEEMNKPPSNLSISNSNNAPNTNETNSAANK